MRCSGLITLGFLLAGALACRKGAAPDAAPDAEPATLAAPTHSAPQAGPIRAEGRLATYPGGEVTISAEVDGRIVRLPADEGTPVRKGELLVELASDEERAARAEARAQLAAAEAALELAESDLGRQSRLKQAQAISDQSLDRTRRERDAARARRDAARETVERRAAHLAKMRITSPLSGRVITRHVEAGETVSPGMPILTVADPHRSRVEAEVDEFDAARLRVRAPVIITAEGYEQTWRGRVNEIPGAVTSRRLKPQDPGRPSDTRVLIVKIALDEPVPLRLGQRVEVEIGRSH
jgi:RND family efflux transporter MFP subunit